MNDISINTENKSRQYFLPFFYVLLVLVCFYPYEFYSAYPFLNSSNQQVLFLFLSVLTIVLSIIFGKKNRKVPYVLIVVVIIQCMWMLLNNIVKGKAIGLGVFMTPLLALSLVFFIHSTCGFYEFYKRYNNWILIMTTMGALSFFLVRVGVLKPLYLFIDLSDEDTMLNYGLTFSQNMDTLFAYCGYFDEPGTIAYWSMFALLFNKYFINNRMVEIALIITTLFSFSMGFYIQLLVYLIVFHILAPKERNGKLISIIIISIFGLMVYWSLSTQTSANSDVYDKTIGRIVTAFDDSKTQGLAVDDRAQYTLQAQKEFDNNPYFGTERDNVVVAHNIYEPLALYGLIGTFFLYLPFLMLFIRAFLKRDYELLRCMIVIITGFTHRPFHSNLLAYFIIYSMLFMCSNNEMSRNYNLRKLRQQN